MIDLQKLFIKNGLTLSLAESCSGGLIASLLTKTPGSSLYFLGSFVVYCNKMKTDILGVDRVLLEEKTAVDIEVAKQMCQGVLEKTESDYAVAVTGDAGPDGAKVGTVYGAIGTKDKIYAGQIPNLEELTREEVQQKCSAYLLVALYNLVDKGEIPFDNK